MTKKKIEVDDPPPARKTSRGLYPEIKCMTKIDRLLADLDDPDAVCRILYWLWNLNMGCDPPGKIQSQVAK